MPPSTSTDIAILGANGHIGKGLIWSLAAAGCALRLYARRPEAVAAFLADSGLAAGPAAARITVGPLTALGESLTDGVPPPDAVINAVGLGDPAKVREQAARFLRDTEREDNRVLDFLDAAPQTLYVFLSSGAVYGKDFARPPGADAVLALPVNRPDPTLFYGLAKHHAECKHRGAADRAIVDIRVFGYMSRFIDLDNRLFLAELVRALVDGTPFITAPADMIRDYAGPDELSQLILRCLTVHRANLAAKAPPLNCALDLRTLAPAGKFEILETLAARFGLRFEVDRGYEAVNATGAKPSYYSAWNAAADAVGFIAGRSSLDVVAAECARLLESRAAIEQIAAHSGG